MAAAAAVAVEAEVEVVMVVRHAYSINMQGRVDEKSKGSSRTKEILPIHKSLHLVGLGYGTGGGEQQGKVRIHSVLDSVAGWGSWIACSWIAGSSGDDDFLFRFLPHPCTV